MYVCVCVCVCVCVHLMNALLLIKSGLCRRGEQRKQGQVCLCIFDVLLCPLDVVAEGNQHVRLQGKAALKALASYHVAKQKERGKSVRVVVTGFCLGAEQERHRRTLLPVNPTTVCNLILWGGGGGGGGDFTAWQHCATRCPQRFRGRPSTPQFITEVPELVDVLQTREGAFSLGSGRVASWPAFIETWGNY